MGLNVEDAKIPHGRPTGKEKAWAVVRLVLGLAQMIGAVVSLYLLLQIGLASVTLGAVVFTCACTTASVLLFGGRGRKSG
jgi:hypothetical protein